MNEPLFPLLGISRLRMETDGEGVTTLVAAMGCPLRCRMCLNPHSLLPAANQRYITPQELYEEVRIDDLYFQATGGGLTFGGGEPLLNADFIWAFREIVGSRWKLRAETSLHISRDALVTAACCLDEFIIDVKDTDPAIYHSYTGQDNAIVLENLRYLLSVIDPERILIRVPEIPGYNSPEDAQRSVEMLKEIGFTRFDRFRYRVPKEKN